MFRPRWRRRRPSTFSPCSRPRPFAAAWTPRRGPPRGLLRLRRRSMSPRRHTRFRAAPCSTSCPAIATWKQTVADVAFFLSALEGLPPEAAERAVLPFPSHEIDPYRGMAPHFGVVSARARALYGLSSGTVRVVVASAAALAPRVSNPERLRNAAVDLKPGLDIAPSDLGELLVDAGLHARRSGGRTRRVRDSAAASSTCIRPAATRL